MVILGYGLPTLLILALLIIRRRPAGYGRLLNSLSVANAAVCLGLTVYLMVQDSFPRYFLGGHDLFIDLLGIYQVLIASAVFLLAAFYARGYVYGLLQAGEIDRTSLKLFYAAFNLLLVVIIFAFFANNLALFWLLLELTTILSAVLIVTLNARENILAALKYVFIASTAMLFSFIGIIIVFAMTQHALGKGTLNWTELMAAASSLPANLAVIAFIFLFIGFAAKAGIVPFHTWLPPAHAKAPSVISALLSAVLLNLGVYGVLRVFAVVRQASHTPAAPVLLITFGVVSIGIAAFSMLARENIKKLIAFSSIEHMGLLLVGIGLGTPVTIFWVLFHNLGHALVKSLLFFSAGILHRQYGSNKYQDMSDVLGLQPLASAGIIIGGAAIIGTPLFPIFLSKLFILIQLGSFSLPLLLVVLVFLLIAAAAFALFLVRTCCRKTEGVTLERYRVPWSMKAPIIVLMVAILALGIFFPQSLQNMLRNIVASLGF
ncbi:MAG: proton-conducting transporter membrane subunit [Dehalococcoidales bacterium]|nr:proton-conducting transporter membrane subunit [Dehalococcoidales bacterium]